jgi:predicted ester cyclase
MGLVACSDSASRCNTAQLEEGLEEGDDVMSQTEPPPTRPAQNPVIADDQKAVCARSIHIMAGGDLPEFEAVVHPEAVNREAVREPMASRGRGPAAFYATALWLRGAFSDLHWDIHEIAADGDLVAVHSTMSGRHTGPFVQYDGAGAVSQVMPPTGRSFSSTQTHWLRIADGKVIEHWANRDDLATAQQAGWVPPSPRYLIRMALAKRRARRT